MRRMELYTGDFLNYIVKSQAETIKYLDDEFESSGYYQNKIHKVFLKNKLALMLGNLFILQSKKDITIAEINKILVENRVYTRQILNKSLDLCVQQYLKEVGVFGDRDVNRI